MPNTFASLNRPPISTPTGPAADRRRSRCPSRVRPRATVIAPLAAALVLSAAASASAAGSPPTVEETFFSTSVEQTFTVPVGVSSVRVQAIGAAGEGGRLAPGGTVGSGGSGAVVTGALPVTAGETLYVEVAGHGFDGGGLGGFGGGSGGDASDVRTVPMASTGTLESRLLVAAGGGGGGGAFVAGVAGSGGNAGSPGANGASGNSHGGGVGGATGTLTGGGAGGSGCGFLPAEGTGGSAGQGGFGGNDFGAPQTGGGGGGGGYFGGGGAAGTCPGGGSQSTGGGGGGGSSFVYGGATFSSFGAASLSTAPSVSIGYLTPATATPGSSEVTFAATQSLQTVSSPQTVTITNTGGNPLQITGMTFTGSNPPLASDAPEDFLIGSSTCLGQIAFEASCQLTVRFAPQATGAQTGTLQLLGNMGAGSTIIALSGTGGTLPQGSTGSTGPAGAPGTQGAPGAGGPVGKQGLPGKTVVYECHPRRKHGRYKNACFVRVPSVAKPLVSAMLTRDGVVYGRTAGAIAVGRQLILQVSRSVPAGRYTLVLVSKSGTTKQTITVD